MLLMKKIFFVWCFGVIIGCEAKNEKVDNEKDDFGEYFSKGLEALDNGEFEIAIDCFTKCINLKPNNKKRLSNAYYNLGCTLIKVDKKNEALDNLKKAIELNPDFASAYRNIGILKEELGIPFCEDFKKGCELGNEGCCIYFENDC